MVGSVGEGVDLLAGQLVAIGHVLGRPDHVDVDVLLQQGRVLHTGLAYLGLNLIGSLLVIVSLLFHWNMPAFLLEAAWALISMYGIYKYLRTSHD